MARIRSVRPELRTSLTVAEWPREVRYFWVLLWGYLDDHGYGVDDVRLIKADCFPLDDDLSLEIIDKWLDVFAAAGSICRYAVSGRRYLHAPRWAEYQRPQHPAVPKLPACSRESHESPSGESHETYGGAVSPNGSSSDSGVSGDSHETFTHPPESLTPKSSSSGSSSGEVAVAREARKPAARTLLGNAILDEHKRLCSPAPPRDVTRRVGDQIDSLLDDREIAPDEIREALKRLRGNRKWGPGMLPSLVDEVRRERAGTGVPAPRGPVPTTHQRMAAIQALKGEPEPSDEPHVIPGSVVR